MKFWECIIILRNDPRRILKNKSIVRVQNSLWPVIPRFSKMNNSNRLSARFPAKLLSNFHRFAVQETDIFANYFIFRRCCTRALKERPLAREEGKERPLNADGGRTRWRWRASFKVEAYLRIPLPPLRLLSAARMEARVFYVTLVPVPEKRRRKRTRGGEGSSSFIQAHVEHRVEMYAWLDSNSRVIKFLQFKFPAHTPYPALQRKN